MSIHDELNLLLHPVRLRIVTEIFGREMTSKQLGEALPDIAQATLYRQIKALLDAGLLIVVSEASVNGATERTYRLDEKQLNFKGRMESVEAEEHVRYFSIFAASLIDTFARYAQHTAPKQISEEAMLYSSAVVYLSEEEKQDFEQAIEAAFNAVIGNRPSQDRQRHTLASVLIPDDRPT